LHNSNTTSKKVFKHVTGITLPASNKETYSILEIITQKDYQGMIKYKQRKEAEEKQQEIFYKLITRPEPKFEECYGEYLKKYDLEMFITKESYGYGISDIKSGIKLVNGKTKDELFSNLKILIDKMGTEGVKAQLNKYIESFGTSPKVA
jgi:hypothetical protein